MTLQPLQPVDLFAEMVRILDGRQPTLPLPQPLAGRVVRSQPEPRTGLEGVLGEILDLVADEVQR